MKLEIELPDALFADLTVLAKQQHEPWFGPKDFCEELIAADLASRRLVSECKTESRYAPSEYRIALPTRRV